MATDLLNAHPTIAIQDEMHSKTLEAYFEMLDEVNGIFDRYSERKGKPLDGWWQKAKSALAHSFFIAANKKGPVGTEKRIVAHGIKTPGFERYLSQFEAIFHEVPPVYIYCMRRADYVWRSWKSIGYLEDFDLFYQRYMRSLRQAKALLDNDPMRFLLFDLDAFVGAGDPLGWFQDNILERIPGVEGSQMPEEAMPNNRNSLKRKGKEYSVDDTLGREMEALVNDSDLNRLRDNLQAG